MGGRTLACCRASAACRSSRRVANAGDPTVLTSARMPPEALVDCADATHSVTLPASAPLASCFDGSPAHRQLTFEVSDCGALADDLGTRITVRWSQILDLCRARMLLRTAPAGNLAGCEQPWGEPTTLTLLVAINRNPAPKCSRLRQVWNVWTDFAPDSCCAACSLPLSEFLATATAAGPSSDAAPWHERWLPLAIKPEVEESAVAASGGESKAALHLAFRCGQLDRPLNASAHTLCLVSVLNDAPDSAACRDTVFYAAVNRCTRSMHLPWNAGTAELRQPPSMWCMAKQRTRRVQPPSLLRLSPSRQRSRWEGRGAATGRTLGQQLQWQRQRQRRMMRTLRLPARTGPRASLLHASSGLRPRLGARSSASSLTKPAVCLRPRQVC